MEFGIRYVPSDALPSLYFVVQVPIFWLPASLIFVPFSLTTLALVSALAEVG